MIGCFVVDRLYFEEIGLLDEGMEVYGGENVELGIRVSNNTNGGHGPMFIQVMCEKLTTILTALKGCLEEVTECHVVIILNAMKKSHWLQAV